MIHSNYLNLLNIMSTRNKGFWRLDAISRLSKRINEGQSHLKFLKNLITRHEKQNHSHSFLQINSVKTLNKRSNTTEKGRSKSSQTFFVTQIPKSSKRFDKYNDKLFMNEYEENMYNPIELYPFEIKYTRQRDENQKYFNVQEIKKEIEKNYNYIRSQQIKNRPFTSSYKNTIDQNLFSYEHKNKSLNINNYYLNNRTMSKKRKRDYKINFINNKYINLNSSINQNWNNYQQKKRTISAYLKNKISSDIFGEENELFEKIKKNRALLNKLLKKTKMINNYSTMTDNDNDSNVFNQKNGLNNNINKEETNKNNLNSIDNEKNINTNFIDDKKYKNFGRKIKSAKINKNIILKHNNNDFKHNIFSNIKQNYKNKNFNSLFVQSEKNRDLIKKKSKVVKVI